jgi:hypothetical protein
MRLGNILAILLLVGVGFVIWQLVDVRQTETGQMPAVSVRDGQLPKFDLDVGRIEIGEKAQTVDVPTLQMQEREVNLPSITVEKPAETTND